MIAGPPPLLSREHEIEAVLSEVLRPALWRRWLEQRPPTCPFQSGTGCLQGWMIIYIAEQLGTKGATLRYQMGLDTDACWYTTLELENRVIPLPSWVNHLSPFSFLAHRPVPLPADALAFLAQWWEHLALLDAAERLPR